MLSVPCVVQRDRTDIKTISKYVSVVFSSITAACSIFRSLNLQPNFSTPYFRKSEWTFLAHALFLGTGEEAIHISYENQWRNKILANWTTSRTHEIISTTSQSTETYANQPNSKFHSADRKPTSRLLRLAETQDRLPELDSAMELRGSSIDVYSPPVKVRGINYVYV